jgi:ribosomal protein S18 acetylase RimI-like enzyme
MHPLDNPIWNALNTRQENFAVVQGPARKFPAEVTTLAGFAEPSQESLEALEQLLKPGKVVGLFLHQAAKLPAGLTSFHELPLAQMWREGDRHSAKGASASGNVARDSKEDFVELVIADVPEMVALAKLTEPGPFGTRTRELGTYIGIKKNGKLAAMAGERLKVPGFTEISAVCTHPTQTGHGYASALVAELTARIHARGETPFLHSREDNVRAIDVYKRLGFTQRLRFHLMVVGKAK